MLPGLPSPRHPVGSGEFHSLALPGADSPAPTRAAAWLIAPQGAEFPRGAGVRVHQNAADRAPMPGSPGHTIASRRVAAVGEHGYPVEHAPELQASADAASLP